MTDSKLVVSELELDCDFESQIDEDGRITVKLTSVEYRGIQIKQRMKTKEVYALETSIEADLEDEEVKKAL